MLKSNFCIASINLSFDADFRYTPNETIFHENSRIQLNNHFIFIYNQSTMSSSLTFGKEQNPRESMLYSQRIRINKRVSQIGSKLPIAEEGGQKSLDLAQALQHQKQMAQSYRQKNEKNIQKCRFLYSKLMALGSLEGIPEMVSNELNELDVRMKQLQQQLFFKKSQQMKKLKKKVSTFLQLINFQVLPEDMEKIEDQIQIILFLIDVFQEKFNEMTVERKEIDQILARLEENSAIKTNTQIQVTTKKESQFLRKISVLQAELQKLKNQDIKKLELNQMKREQIRPVDQLVLSKNQQIEKISKRNQQLEYQMAEMKKKMQILQGSIERVKRDEVRWKERYREMEARKNERIKLLEDSLSKNLANQ